MRSFFIDLENVRSYGLEGILLLKPEDKVYVFYSDNANTLTIPTIESLNESSASVKYIKTNYTGANAMDFQIVTLLGASIEKEQKGSFYIISHDNGFKSAVKFCEGYFTSGYDIVTGVFANILLAINSEKNDKKSVQQKNTKEEKAVASGEGQKETANNQEKDGKETSTGRNKRRRNRNQRNKQNAEAVQNVENKSLTEADTNMTGMAVSENNPTFEENAAAITASEEPEKTSDNENRKSRNRNQRRRSRNRNHSENNTGNVSAADEAKDVSVEADAANDGFMIIQASEGNTEKEERKPQREKKNPKPAPGKNAKNSNYRYVYNALSDYLSQNTIEMYAAKIDEGIRKSSNKDELHKFFKKNYGADEAEALYKIIYSDFDKMKKEAES